MKMVDTPQNIQIVSELVSQALGGSPRVRFVLLYGEQTATEPAQPAPEAEQVYEHELVSRITQEFDAHEV
jgi:hypothetical protein